jgi:hypothetical protein
MPHQVTGCVFPIVLCYGCTAFVCRTKSLLSCWVCSRHPDADTLYVEKVDVGEPEPRCVIRVTSILLYHLCPIGLFSRFMYAEPSQSEAEDRFLTMFLFRTIVSGLVKYISMKELKGPRVVVLEAYESDTAICMRHQVNQKTRIASSLCACSGRSCRGW